MSAHQPNRSQAAELGRQTLRILQEGRFTAPSGAIVDISAAVRHAREGTRSFPPSHPLPERRPGNRVTQFESTDETTLEAARRWTSQGWRVCALNFASAKNPGGGFLSGSRAQEESLARSSGLFACLDGNPMYEFHRAGGDPFYSDYVLHSPDVPVFRDDAGALLERPYACSFLTCPAVNAGAVRTNRPEHISEIVPAMRRRTTKVLSAAVEANETNLILGAWGCGVFANDPETVAALFDEALSGPFRGAFERVVFAVWDPSGRIGGPFARRFRPDSR